MDGAEYAASSYINPDTTPPAPYFEITAQAFGADDTAWNDWAEGDTVIFETTEGSTTISVTNVNSAAGTFDSTYLTVPDAGLGAVTDTWTIEIYVDNLGYRHYYITGAATGQIRSGYFSVTSRPWSSEDDAAADQWTLYYNETTGMTAPCAPYMWRFEGAAWQSVLQSLFETITGVSWPSGEDWVARDILFFNPIFGVNLTDFSGLVTRMDAAAAEIFDNWFDLDWAADGTPDSAVGLWLTTGIVENTNGAVVFDAYSVCTDRNYPADDCNDYVNRFISDLHLYRQQNNMVSGAALEYFNLVNSERADAGLDNLVINPNLQAAAERHAQDMAANLFEGHTGSDGSTFSERILGADYLFYRHDQYQSMAYGENTGATTEDPEVLVSGWMSSDDHRDNILHADYTETGVAAFIGEDGITYVCQTFGYRAQRWPGFGPVNTAGIQSYLESNFTWGGTGDETRLPRLYVVYSGIHMATLTVPKEFK